MQEFHPDYPSAKEVDEWCDVLLGKAEARRLDARPVERQSWDFRLGVRHTGGSFVAFESQGHDTFYGFWQGAPSGRGPLLVHVPGYGAEMSAHPELVSMGWNVLHVNPLGYATPDGPDEAKRPGGTWPVLPDTVRSLGREGYVDWLEDAAAAALWAMGRDGVESNRLAFFGTSQGGGTALLLSSILAPRGVRCAAADVPFLINFPLMHERSPRGAHELALIELDRIAEERPDDLAAAWRALGFADVLCHAHRLSMPTLLTAGGEDPTCHPDTIRSLFDVLPGTRSYTELAGQGHGYTGPFLALARAWFQLYL